MADWDKFILSSPGKVIVNNKIELKELDILELPSGKYFLDKNIIFTNEAFEKLKKYSEKELKEDVAYPIYIQVGHVEGGKSGITTRITDLSRLNKIIQEIENIFI